MGCCFVHMIEPSLHCSETVGNTDGSMWRALSMDMLPIDEAEKNVALIAGVSPHAVCYS